MDLGRVFEHRLLTPAESQRAERIWAAARALAEAIAADAPRCADQSAAIRKVREAATTATAAIQLEGHV